MMDKHLLAYYVGILIVFSSHAWMLYDPKPLMTMQQHAYLNLVAALLIAYHFMWSSGYIKF